jgi:type IV pilus assembly protein PilY1
MKMPTLMQAWCRSPQKCVPRPTAVHSQPAVIDYGGTIGTIAFYGDDEGVFHAVDGRQADTNGIELWGFIAPETFSKLNRLRTNSPAVAYPGVTGSPAPTPKDYFFDGSIGVYQKSGTVWIFPSMRRGGRALYAFDVSTPTSPVLKWRKGCFTSDTTDDTVCSTGWSGIGQTWSSPIIAYLSGYVDGSGIPKPVLIFGGGYDQCEDTNSQTRCTTTPRKGANIWFVDANTGAILRTYPTNYSVPGDLAPLKDGNGNLTYVYASDTGGNVYRINVGTYDGTTFTAWSNNTAASNIILASLSETNHARKFLNGPSVVPSVNYNAVLLGSGDREHPLVTDYACTNYSTTAGSFVTNQFYMLMDTPTGYPTTAWTPSVLADVTSGTTTSTTVSGTTTITNSVGPTTSTKGWRFNFGQCEQTVNKALTIAGITYFGTNAPSAVSATSCTANLGIARGYAVDYLTGNATGGTRSGVYVGGGMPPSPVAGVVNVDGTKYPFCIGCIDPTAANASALQGSKVIINPTGSRYRPYWYIEGD